MLLMENTAIVEPLNYLSNFWRSFKIPLINCKLELKLRQAKYSVLCAGGNDNSDNIIFNIKGTKLYVAVLTLLARDNQKVAKTSQQRI